MVKLSNLYENKLQHNLLLESLDNREDILEFVVEIQNVLHEYNFESNEYITELLDANKLSSGKLQKLFVNAEKLTKGEELKVGLLQRAKDKAGDVAGVIRSLNEIINKAAKKLQDTAPVQQFDLKVNSLLAKWKDKLGDDNKAVQTAIKLGEYGKQNPKKTAFIIGAITALTSVIGTPAFGAAGGTVLRTALGLAQGERVSTATGQAAKVAGIGALAGAVLSDFGAGDILKSWGEELTYTKQAFKLNGQQFSFQGLITQEQDQELKAMWSEISSDHNLTPEETEQFLQKADEIYNGKESQEGLIDKFKNVLNDKEKSQVMKNAGLKLGVIGAALTGGEKAEPEGTPA